MSADVNGSGLMLLLHAAGFNAHGQLDPGSNDDLKSFEDISATHSTEFRILFAGWSTTVFVDGDRIFSIGQQRLNQNLAADVGALRSAIGDHDGMLACLDEHGRLCVVDDEQLVCKSADSSPRIGWLAHASNDRIAMTAMQTPNGQLCHLTEFDTFETFLRWHEDPSGAANYPTGHHMLPGRPKSLLGNVANFVLLMESGDVWTWGDSRHQSLGRETYGDGAVPADQPGQVEALGGISIKCIAVGGWQAAALSTDGALYIWGAQNPGSEYRIKSLVPNEVSLVSISSGTDEEPLDILGVGIGSNHMAVLTENHTLYVAGENHNGQIGRGSEDAAFREAWHLVVGLSDVRDVVCAPLATIVHLGTA